jgi:hypothetical protein
MAFFWCNASTRSCRSASGAAIPSGAGAARTRAAVVEAATRCGLGWRLVPARILRRRHAARRGESDECRIDVLVQAWAVLSGVAPPERASRALECRLGAARFRNRRHRALLAPPFENTSHDPGYIKATCAACARTAASTRIGRLGFAARSPSTGWRDRAARVLELLNPILSTRTAEQIATYRVEPYVIAADVYGAPPARGAGGWTWYTDRRVDDARRDRVGARIRGRRGTDCCTSRRAFPTPGPNAASNTLARKPHAFTRSPTTPAGHGRGRRPQRRSTAPPCRSRRMACACR